MPKFYLYILTLFSILPLLACQKSNNEVREIDNKSYITEFELIQENPKNDTLIKISSPKAIIDPKNNDIEIFDSSILILNKKSQDVQINSGNSKLNNFKNLIRAYNNVYISLLDNNNYFIQTNSLDWDLNSSKIVLNSPLDITFGNTSIISSHGAYNIDSRILTINNNIFNRSIYNAEGKETYNIEIISDNAKWLKTGNLLEFTSTDNQVETTINFLSTK